ncbi:hypothetical protein ABH892_003995 [Paenibacillus sp. RC254]
MMYCSEYYEYSMPSCKTEIYSYFMLFTSSTYYLRQSIEISSVLFDNLDTTEETIDSYSKLRKENASEIDFYVMHFRDYHASWLAQNDAYMAAILKNKVSKS